MKTPRQGQSCDAQATRRSFMTSALALAALASGRVTGAERWPSRPITVVSTGPAGSGPDTRARELFTHIGMALGQPIVVENMPGAGGIIAMEHMRRASPDGHRFIFTHIGAVVINPSLFKTLPYDPVRDFDPVSIVLESPMILVAPTSLGIESLAQLLDLAKRKPGTLMYASAGNGTPPHMFVEQLKAATQMSIDHVPFKGSPGVVQALVGAQVAVGMEAAGALMPLIETGRVRALAVTGSIRMEGLPQVPTFLELGVPDIGLSWLAVMAPKGTLPEAVTAMNREITRALALPDFQRSLVSAGSRPLGGPPEVLGERIRAELPRWKTVIDRAGIRPD
jgi:tripartite-type tricarboxylate transporter receptor subunit TctC